MRRIGSYVAYVIAYCYFSESHPGTDGGVNPLGICILYRSKNHSDKKIAVSFYSDCVLPQTSVYSDTVLCATATAVSGIWCYCNVRYCSRRYVVILFCVLLQSPICGGTVLCATAVSSMW